MFDPGSERHQSIQPGQTWRWKSGDIKILVEDLHLGMVHYRTLSEHGPSAEVHHMRASSLLLNWNRQFEFHPVVHATIRQM